MASEIDSDASVSRGKGCDLVRPESAIAHPSMKKEDSWTNPPPCVCNAGPIGACEKFSHRNIPNPRGFFSCSFSSKALLTLRTSCIAAHSKAEPRSIEGCRLWLGTKYFLRSASAANGSRIKNFIFSGSIAISIPIATAKTRNLEPIAVALKILEKKQSLLGQLRRVPAGSVLIENRVGTIPQRMVFRDRFPLRHINHRATQ